jgi:hypothetical protein
MTDTANSYLEQANNFIVNIMFCASPNELTTLKVNGEKYLYTIFCLQIIENGNFVIFLKVFKPLKRKNKHGLLFKIQENTTQLFETITDANHYLNTFLNSFIEHTRTLNELSHINESVPGGEAILLINNWERNCFSDFNTLIANSLKISS